MRSLRSKLWIGFGSLLTILLIVSTLSLIVFTRYSRTIERVFRENYDSAVYLDGMKQSIDVLNLRAQQLIWQEAAARAIDPATPEQRFETNLKLQMGNCVLPGELEKTQRLASLWKNYRGAYDQFDQLTGERTAYYTTNLLPRYEELKRLAQEIANMNVSSMVSADGEAKKTLLQVRNALLVLVAAGVTLAALVVWMAIISILRPLSDLTESARQIESGNLDLNLPTRSRDEIGKLASAFNSMAMRLREFKQRDHDRLVRTEQTTQLAIDSLPDAVFVIGQDHAVEISNLAARKLFGIEPARPISELGFKWLPGLYDEVIARRQPVIPTGYAAAVQLFVDEEERFFLPQAVPMASQDGRQLGVTVILADVTQLRRVDEAKSDLISTVAHELRTPLTSQRLMLGLLTDHVSKQLTSTQQRMLSVAKADGDRLFRTIEDLLSISRIESGRVQFQIRPTALGEFMKSKIDPLRELFKEKSLDLTVDLPTDLPTVQIDAAAMGSAVTNLLSNAMKFTPPGGRVDVTAAANGESVTIRVADTGPGIPEEHRPRIFEKFFRVPVKSGPSGAGLGLSITRDIVEAHGGRVSFDCPPAGGSIFSINLPILA